MAEGQEAVVRVLRGCLNPDMKVQKEAEKALEEMSGRHEFFEALFVTAADGSVEDGCRELAAIAMRQQVERCWRPRSALLGPSASQHVIPDEQKQQIRAGLLHLLQADTLQSFKIVRLVAMLVATVCRQETANGRKWPELLELLSSGIQKDDVRCVATLHHVLLQLLRASTVAGKREPFQDMCTLVAPAASALARKHSEQFLITSSPNSLLLCCLAHKVMLRVLRGVIQSEQEAPVQEYCEATFAFLRELMSRRMREQNPAVRDTLDRVLKKALKAVSEPFVQSPQKYAMRGVLAGLFSLSTDAVALAAPAGSPLPGFFTLQCLLVIEQVVMLAESSPPTREAFSTVFRSEQQLQQFALLLVSKYLCLHSYELALWEEDPEGFVCDQEAEDCDVNVKEKAASVFSGLTDENRGTLVRGFADSIDGFISNPEAAPEAVESAYFIMGLGCYSFPSVLPEQKQQMWLRQAMTHARGHPSKYVARRALWVLGQWVYSVPEEQHGEVSACLIAAQCDSRNDLVLRLTALNALREYVTNSMSVNAFRSLLPQFLASLFDLLRQMKIASLKENTLAMVKLLVDAVTREEFEPYCSQLVEVLKAYWTHEQKETSKEVNGTLVVEQIIACLASVVRRLGLNPAVHDFACNIVMYATNTEQPDYLELVDHGVELWYQALAATKEMTLSLRRCYTLLPPLFDKEFLEYEKLLCIAREYFLVGGAEFLGEHGKEVLQCLLTVLQCKKGEILIIVCGILDDFLLAFPQYAAEAAPLVGQILHLLAQQEEGEYILGCFATVFARLVVANRPVAIQLLTSTSSDVGALLDCVIEISDDISRPDSKKLCALAFLSLSAPPPDPRLLQRFDTVMQLAVEAVTAEEGDAAHQFQISVMECRGVETETPEDEAQRRKLQIMEKDPVLVSQTRDWLSQTLSELSKALGPEGYASLLNTVGAHNRQPLGI